MLSVLLKLCLYLHLWISIGVSFWHFQFRQTTPSAREKKRSYWAQNETKLWLGRPIAFTVEGPQRLKCPRKIVHAMALFFLCFLLDCFGCTYRDWVHVGYITRIGYIFWNCTTIDIATKSHQQVNNGLPFKNYFHPAKWPQTIQKLAFLFIQYRYPTIYMGTNNSKSLASSSYFQHQHGSSFQL